MKELKNNNLSDIQQSFSEQAGGFNSKSYHLSKAEYENYMIEKTAPAKEDTVLEVAAGTCICGRAFAHQAAHVICLDATDAMLSVGKEEAEKEKLSNMTFVRGVAEELPFLDNSFEIVISRLAFHHFVNPKEIFAEMKRVLRPGGKLVLMDMTVEQEKLRDEVDRIERMRDFSHVKDLTTAEMKELYAKNKMQLVLQEKIDIPVSLNDWLNLTHTKKEQQDCIINLMKQDMAGQRKTGFSPYEKDGKIYFNHHWVFNMGIK